MKLYKWCRYRKKAAKNPVWLGTDMFIYRRTSLAKNFGKEPNVSTTIQSSSSVAIQNRGDAYLNKLGEVKWREINGSDSYVMACME